MTKFWAKYNLGSNIKVEIGYTDYAINDIDYIYLPSDVQSSDEEQ